MIDRLPARLRSKLRIDASGCWIWTGAQNGRGYGHCRVGGKGGGPVRPAHRVVYLILIGIIPIGLEPDHTCRVKLCVNPAHIELVTRAENVRRSWLYRDEAGRRKAA